MANKQAASPARSSTTTAKNRPSARSSGHEESVAYERDENYGLISVLYHTLKGADTATKFIRDAREAEDEELVEFFEETRAEYVRRAAAAEVLLGSRLESAILEDEEEEEEEDN
jgi:hypothetical protein